MDRDLMLWVDDSPRWNLLPSYFVQMWDVE
jgi:hypothetical protein